MKILINERLSEHRCKTPEGYLICTDAILARTGKQTYRKNEIFKDSDDETEIEVDRTEDEVFSPQTLASFENKPVTVEHPDEDVNVHNYKEYAVGFVRDVHRGEANGQPVILGNLVITDEQTIQEIENGEHTDLSCGYDCDIADEANPCQRNIRGNHVALCECGRAGIARIVDSIKDKLVEPSKQLINDVIISMTSLGFKVGYTGKTWSGRTHLEFGKSCYSDREYHQLINEVDKHLDKIERRYNAPITYNYAGDCGPNGSGQVTLVVDINKMQIHDANHLPAKVKRDLQKFLNHKSTFISNKDYDIAEFVKEFERIARLWAEFPLKIVRESIKGWFKTGDGMMRKDYIFSIEGYDDRFMVSIYAKPETYETTELNAYFTDSVKDALKPGDKVRHVEGDVEVIDKIIHESTFSGKIVKKYVMKSGRKYLAEDIETEHWHKVNDVINDSFDIEFDLGFRKTTESYDSRKEADERYDELIRLSKKPSMRGMTVKKLYDAIHDALFEICYIDNGDVCIAIEAKDENDARRKFHRNYGMYHIKHIRKVKDGVKDMKAHKYLDDSVNDALIPPTKESINKFEVLLRIFDIKIDRKGLTPLGRVHYQVRANMEFDRFVKILHQIDDEMDKLGIPMTFNAGFDGKTCTAGIDLDKQYVKDSQRAQKIQKIIKVVKSIK